MSHSSPSPSDHPTFGTTPLCGENLLLTGGAIYPSSQHTAPASALVVTAGVVTFVGSDAEARAHATAEHPEIDLGGATVLPGMIDAHTHIYGSTVSRQQWLNVRGLTVEASCAVIAEAVQRQPAGTWVRAQGRFLQPLPTKAQLDAVSPEHPVLIRESAHKMVANTLALRAVGLDAHAPVLGGAAVVHVDEHGVPTGLIEEALDIFPSPEATPEELRQQMHAELRTEFAARGVTTVLDIPVAQAGVQACFELAEANDLPVRMTVTPFLSNDGAYAPRRIELWDALQLGDQINSDLIAAGGAKIMLDGDNEQMFDSQFFNQEPRQWGVLTRTLGRLRDEMVWGIEHDIQVWVHAIGDLAQEMVLEAIDQAQQRAGQPRLPMRIEHAANLALSPYILRRLRELNVIPVPTANFISVDDRAGVYAYRTLIDQGFQPPGNSDTLGSVELAPSPWYGMRLMVQRINNHGQLIAPEEAITVAEGYTTYTDYSAAAAGYSDVLGKLEPGFAADFAVYETDPRTLPLDELDGVTALRTYVGGREVWVRP